jgi:hypothetical protein
LPEKGPTGTSAADQEVRPSTLLLTDYLDSFFSL